jgi:hypothetical protein
VLTDRSAVNHGLDRHLGARRQQEPRLGVHGLGRRETDALRPALLLAPCPARDSHGDRRIKNPADELGERRLRGGLSPCVR